MKGLFISFEGNDGCGKTTQILKLSKWFQLAGRETALIREPGGTAIGEKIRSLLLDLNNQEMTAEAEMLLYAASRAQLVRQVIRPALESGKVILCDRFVDSSYAYQGFGRQLGLDYVQKANVAAIDGTIPDMTFFLNLPPEQSMLRRMGTGEAADRLEQEQLDFHARVYEGYHFLAEADPARIRVVDATLSPDLLSCAILRHITQKYYSSASPFNFEEESCL